MIKKIQRKYIMLTATVLLGVIVVLVTSIIIVNYNNGITKLDERLDMVFKNAGKMPEFRNRSRKVPRDEMPKFDIKEDINDDKDMVRHNFSDITRFGTVIMDSNKNVLSVDVEKISSLTEAEMKIIASSIIKKDRERGWIEQYRYKYDIYEDGYMIVIVNGTFEKQANSSLALVAAIVALVCYAVVLTVIVLFSGKIIKPISDSYEKQKQFITDASHELKTPLTIIMANAEILELSDENNEWIQGIKKQTDKMKELVNSMVALNKMDEESDNMAMEEFFISEAIYDTAMVFKGVCERKGLELDLQIEDEIAYKGNETSIRQLVSVLLDNAVKYCDKDGNITVNLTKGKNIWISVVNDYKEVSYVKLDRLFDRFYRVDKARVRNGSYGLGLSIANLIVNRHNGYLKVKNIDNKKIEFIVTLK